MKKWFEFWTRHLYMVLLILSCAAMSVTGAFMMPFSAESYTEIPALAGAAINEMKNMVVEQEEEGAFFDVAAAQLPEEDDSGAEKDESGAEDDEEEPGTGSEEDANSEGDAEAEGADSKSDPKEKADPDNETDAGDEVDEVVSHEEDSEKEEADDEEEEDDEKSSSKRSSSKKSSSKKKKSSSKKKKSSSKKKKSSSKKKKSSSKKKKSSSKKKKKEDYLNPDWKLVDEDYFNDACFIGDSRELGFGMYSQLENITVYAEKGIQIYKAATKAFINTPEGKITIAQALEQNQGQFKKVYIMFGLNEMGWGDDETLDQYYYNLIDYIKQTQPDAVIFLQSIIHVTTAKAASNPVFSNDSIDARNERLKEIAAKEHIYYLDLNEIFTDENNGLISDATTDGVHLKSQYILLWKEYLMAHGIIRDDEDDD